MEKADGLTDNLWGVEGKGCKGNQMPQRAEYQEVFSSSQACIIYCTNCKLSVTFSETIQAINTSYKVHQTPVQNYLLLRCN